jgi:hypothetical protein
VKSEIFALLEEFALVEQKTNLNSTRRSLQYRYPIGREGSLVHAPVNLIQIKPVF